MQAVKEKLQDMNALRKVKAEAKAEEKAEKDMAKARMYVAHEVRLAREAEAQMELHTAKAAEKVDQEIAKHSSPPETHQQNLDNTCTLPRQQQNLNNANTGPALGLGLP